jgi:hypothetical protein
MSNYYEPEVDNISPEWVHRDNKGAEERLQLDTVTVTINKSERDGVGWRYELTYSVGPEGMARLRKIENTRSASDKISPGRLATAVPLAESAVSDLLNDIDPARLAVKPYASEFDSDISVPERTTEAEAIQTND